VLDIPRTVGLPARPATSPLLASYNHTIGAVKRSSHSELSYLILHFSPNSTERTSRHIQLDISVHDLERLSGRRVDGGHSVGGGGCSGLVITQRVLNRTTSVHDLIEEELFRSGQKAAAVKRSVDIIDNMATAEGLHNLASDAGRWMELNRKSMQFVPFDTGATEAPGGGCSLDLVMETSALRLLKIVKV
jgi:hypothetical protein